VGRFTWNLEYIAFKNCQRTKGYLAGYTISYSVDFLLTKHKNFLFYTIQWLLTAHVVT
jgi:hypothetical protein